MSFTVHTKDTAPKESKPVLDQVEQAYGFIPNVIGVLAESPLAITAYATVKQCLDTKGMHLIDAPVDYSQNDRLLNKEIPKRSRALEL